MPHFCDNNHVPSINEIAKSECVTMDPAFRACLVISQSPGPGKKWELNKKERRKESRKEGKSSHLLPI